MPAADAAVLQGQKIDHDPGILHKLTDMTKQTIIALLAAILTLMPGMVSAKEKVVNYTEVKHYFHIKDTTLPYNKLITSQADFDKYFSPAAVMGKDGEPTTSAKRSWWPLRYQRQTAPRR